MLYNLRMVVMARESFRAGIHTTVPFFWKQRRIFFLPQNVVKLFDDDVKSRSSFRWEWSDNIIARFEGYNLQIMVFFAARPPTSLRARACNDRNLNRRRDVV